MIPPVVREILVPASAAEAFRRFTAEMSSWWPTDTHSVHLDRCDGVVFEAGVGDGSTSARATAPASGVGWWNGSHRTASCSRGIRDGSRLPLSTWRSRSKPRRDALV